MPKAISVYGRRRPEPQSVDLEPINSMGLVESIFLDNIPKDTRDSIERADHSPKAISSLSKPSNIDHRINLAKNKDYSTEKLLLEMYEVHDILVSSFEGLKHTSPLAKNLDLAINKVDECIIDLGGEIEKFSPLDHVSGLTVPSSVKNAYQIIETTKECYKGGEIEEATAPSNNTIFISFLGEDKELNMLYRAEGTINAKSSWNGNEAIDYIYTLGEGRMSVKVLEGGRWVDRSNDYKIDWELQELNLSSATNEELLMFKKIKDNTEKPLNNLPVSSEYIGVDIDDDAEIGEENLDFTIEEK